MTMVSTDTELHNARPNKHMSWLPPDPPDEVGLSQPFSVNMLDTIKQSLSQLVGRDSTWRDPNWPSRMFKDYVIRSVRENGFCPHEVFAYVYTNRNDPMFLGLMIRLINANYLLASQHGWLGLGILDDIFTRVYPNFEESTHMPGVFPSVPAPPITNIPGVFSSLLATTLSKSYVRDLIWGDPNGPCGHYALMESDSGRRRPVVYAEHKIYINGIQDTGETRRVLWCSKLSNQRLVYVEAVYDFTISPHRHRRENARTPRLNSQRQMEIIMVTICEGEDDADLSYVRFENNKSLFRHVQSYANKGETPPMAAITEDDTVVFILGLSPMETVTYDLNLLVTIAREQVVKEGTYRRIDEYPLFSALANTLPGANVRFLPQSSTIKISGRHVLCGRLVTTTLATDMYPCHPNRFLERFCGQQEQQNSFSTSLQFFYELVYDAASREWRIGGVSSAFHPCILDEPPGVAGATFDRKYSAHQHVVALENWRYGKNQTLLFWRGENTDTQVQVQIFDHKVILAMIRPDRTTRNFSMHANYIRCLKPDLVGADNAEFSMYGHSRKAQAFPHAFNPTIALLDEKDNESHLLVLMRSTDDIVKWSTANHLVAEKVVFHEGGYVVKGQSQIEAGGSHMVDARLLRTSSDLYILFISTLSEADVRREDKARRQENLPQIPVDPKSGRSRLYMRKLNTALSHLSSSSSSSSSPSLGNVEFSLPSPFCHMNARSAEEKNWSPFVVATTDGAEPRQTLYYAYSINPLAVYKVEDAFASHRDCSREDSINLPFPLEHALKQSNLDLRGGSCGIPYGDDFLFVGHAFQSNPDSESKYVRPCFPDFVVGEAKYTGVNEIRNKHYDGMYWVFFFVMGQQSTAGIDEGWRVKKLSMCSQLPGRTSPYPKIAFPTGLVRVRDGYIVSSGEWDSSSVLTFVSDQFMDAILRPVEILDVQSYVTDCALFESLLLDYSGHVVRQQQSSGKGKKRKM